jgi:hypothetical protein
MMVFQAVFDRFSSFFEQKSVKIKGLKSFSG